MGKGCVVDASAIQSHFWYLGTQDFARQIAKQKHTRTMWCNDNKNLLASYIFLGWLLVEGGVGGLYTKWKGKLNLNVIMESVFYVLTNADL